MATEEQTLEQQLEALLDQERFDPPEEFVQEGADHRRRASTRRRRTSRASGPSRPSALDWVEKWDTVLDESDPPFYKWFDGRQAQRRPTTAWTATSRPATATASRSTGAARRARSATITYADLHRDVQRFANALKDHGIEQGRRRRDLPADDPRGRRRDARLRAHRRAAQRRLRRLLAPSRCSERMEVSKAKALDHRRRRAAQGQDRADQGGRRRGDGRPRVARDDLRRPPHRQRRADDATGATSGTHEVAGGGRRRVPGRAARRRAPALHPLLVGLDGQAEGHPAHHRRLPDAGRLHPPRRVRPQAGDRRLLVLGRRRLGHRPLLHRLRAAGERLHVGDVRGRARTTRTRTSGGS